MMMVIFYQCWILSPNGAWMDLDTVAGRWRNRWHPGHTGLVLSQPWEGQGAFVPGTSCSYPGLVPGAHVLPRHCQCSFTGALSPPPGQSVWLFSTLYPHPLLPPQTQWFSVLFVQSLTIFLHYHSRSNLIKWISVRGWALPEQKGLSPSAQLMSSHRGIMVFAFSLLS